MAVLLMRDLIRALCTVILIVLAVHLLAGCGGGDPEPDVLLPTVSCTAGVCK
jgi:uncharacterized membrane protein YqaE (UPF0057 family)